jgi:hypothetical protein
MCPVRDGAHGCNRGGAHGSGEGRSLSTVSRTCSDLDKDIGNTLYYSALKLREAARLLPKSSARYAPDVC